MAPAHLRLVRHDELVAQRPGLDLARYPPPPPAAPTWPLVRLLGAGLGLVVGAALAHELVRVLFG